MEGKTPLVKTKNKEAVTALREIARMIVSSGTSEEFMAQRERIMLSLYKDIGSFLCCDLGHSRNSWSKDKDAKAPFDQLVFCKKLGVKPRLMFKLVPELSEDFVEGFF